MLFSTQSCPTVWDPMDCSTPAFPVLHYFTKFAQTHVQLIDNAIQSSHPLSHPTPPALNLFQHHGLFQWVGSSHQVAKGLELQLQYQSSQWIFRVNFFRIDWFDHLAVQRTLKSLLQHHSLKASILQHSAFFMTSHIHTWLQEKPQLWLYGPLLSKWYLWVMSLLFNMLSRFVIAFLPKSKCLVISWLQSPFAVVLKLKEIKPITVSIFYPSVCHEVMRPEAMISVFWN